MLASAADDGEESGATGFVSKLGAAPASSSCGVADALFSPLTGGGFWTQHADFVEDAETGSPVREKKDGVAVHEEDVTVMAAEENTLPLTERWALEPLPLGGTAITNPVSGQSYEYTFCRPEIRGVPHPGFINPELWELQKAQLTFRTGDIAVCTMSKCGTTLMEQLVLLLLNGGDADALNPVHKSTMDRGEGSFGKIWTEMAVIDGLEGLDSAVSGDGLTTAPRIQTAVMGEGRARMSVADFDALSPPRVLKSHAPRPLFLAEARARGLLGEGTGRGAPPPGSHSTRGFRGELF